MKKYIILIVFFSFNSWAQVGLDSYGPKLEKYQLLYKDTQYVAALEELKNVGEKNITLGDMAYLKAISLSKLQQYDEAIANFKIAVKNNNKNQDLHYEFGQALYGNNNLRMARDEFTRSANKKFNYTASIYYAAYISELLNDSSMAKYNYAKLIKDPNTDKKILQLSLFQYSKILLTMMRKQEKILIQLEKNITKNIPRYIFPLLNKAWEIDKTSELSIEINQLIQTLTTEFSLDPNIMRNGRRISPARQYGYVSFRVKHDNNVALSKIGSALFEAEGYYKKDFVFNKKFITAPDIRFSVTRYKNQIDPEVYLNDSFTISTDLKNRFEHTINKQPASFLVDFDLSRQYKDYNGAHHKEYFYNNFGYSFGEQFNYFNSGETTIRWRKSNYKEINNSLNNNSTSGMSIDQYIFFNLGQQLLIATFDTSSTSFYNLSLLSTSTYSLRLLYLMFEFIPSYTLQLGTNFSFIDTKLQRDSRGNETTFNPSIELSKRISDRLKLSINYNYIKNSSKLVYYNYERQIVGTDLSYNF